jgi:hypothetical protein
LAAEKRYKEVVELLLGAGANVDAKNKVKPMPPLSSRSIHALPKKSLKDFSDLSGRASPPRRGEWSVRPERPVQGSRGYPTATDGLFMDTCKPLNELTVQVHENLRPLESADKVKKAVQCRK